MNPTTSILAAVALSSASYALADDSSSDSVSEQDLLNQAIRSDQMMTDDEFHSTQSESLNALGYRSISTNSSFEELRQDDSISQANFYDSPYRVSLFNPQNGEDSERLWSQTKSIFAYGVGVAGVLALMPESITNWEKDDIKLMNKWWDNVRSGPVWDRDDHVINYIGHPYFGGVYYQAARKSGYRQWDAFMYSTLMSTFYWEYGIAGMVRELEEETGAKNIHGIKPFGIYEEFRPWYKDDADVMHMISFCYSCKVDRELGQTAYEDYEVKNGMKPLWVNIHDAIAFNEKTIAESDKKGMSIERETYLLHLIAKEML